MDSVSSPWSMLPSLESVNYRKKTRFFIYPDSIAQIKNSAHFEVATDLLASLPIYRKALTLCLMRFGLKLLAQSTTELSCGILFRSSSFESCQILQWIFSPPRIRSQKSRTFFTQLSSKISCLPRRLLFFCLIL